MITSYLDIDDLIKSMNIYTIDECENIPTGLISNLFKNNSDVDCVKHKLVFKENFDSSSRKLIKLENNNTYYTYMLPRTNIDIISDIRFKINSEYVEDTDLYFGYNNKIKSDIQNIVLPIINMYFMFVKFMIPVSKKNKDNQIEISYTSYTLSDSIKCKILNKKTIANKNMVFNKGVFETYMI